MMQTTNQAAIEIQARFYHGLADPSRLAILQTLRVGESTVSAVAASAGISISNASRHLACLRDCGLVEARHQWRHVNYRLSDGVAELLAVNDAFIERVTEHIAACHRPEMGD